MPEIAKFVNSAAASITPTIAEKVLRQLPQWKLEFTQINTPHFPHLVDQLEFLADVIEDFAEGVEEELPYAVTAAATFALIYAHRQTDLIPDNIPEYGRADDSAVVRAVLIENEKALAAYAERHKLRFDRISVRP